MVICHIVTVTFCDGCTHSELSFHGEAVTADDSCCQRLRAVRIWVNLEKPYDPKGHSVWDKKKERRREVEEEKEPKPESNTIKVPLCHRGRNQARKQHHKGATLPLGGGGGGVVACRLVGASPYPKVQCYIPLSSRRSEANSKVQHYKPLSGPSTSRSFCRC